jgi:hypothetical protein
MFMETGGRGGPGGLDLALFRTGPKVPSSFMGDVHPPCNRTLLGLWMMGLRLSFSRGFGGLGGRLPNRPSLPTFQVKAD